MPDEKVLCYGSCERIGIDGIFSYNNLLLNKSNKEPHTMQDHLSAFKIMMDFLVSEDAKLVKSFDEIEAIGHRFAHGFNKLTDSCLINDDVLEIMKSLCNMAPLHNPPAINCIEACKKIFSHHPLQVAVFDTAFYKDLLPKVYTYPIPTRYFQKYGIRKIGFHGISHKFVTQEILNKSNKNRKIIICHLGNGCSVTCVKDGVAYDTSLGFGSYSGLLMGTRCGDMDPAVIFYIMRKEKLSVDEMENILIGKSGLSGISGGYSDNRELTNMAMSGHQEATLALQVQAYQVKKYIGSFVAAMGGIDVLVFTAGIGQYSSELRQEICDGLGYMGIILDLDLNKKFNGEKALISSEGSKTQIWILPTNEELLIAQDTYRIVNEQRI